MRGLLVRGVSLQELGPNLGLSAACFHGHWRLCLLLLEHGANVNDQSEQTKETPLHAALCSTDRILYDRVFEVLLSRGANPNLAAADGVVTAGFMRDARTKGETALHRAAAFGEEGTKVKAKNHAVLTTSQQRPHTEQRERLGERMAESWRPGNRSHLWQNVGLLNYLAHQPVIAQKQGCSCAKRAAALP
jgi:hypothetical protein